MIANRFTLNVIYNESANKIGCSLVWLLKGEMLVVNKTKLNSLQ